MPDPGGVADVIPGLRRGNGRLRAQRYRTYPDGMQAPLPFTAPSVLIVPTGHSHWVGDASDRVRVRDAADQCALLGDGLVEFTAGSGADDTLVLCGALPAPYHGAPDLLDLLQAPVVADVTPSPIPAYVFDAMRLEIAGVGLGAQAMCQALMKQGLIALLRSRGTGDDQQQVLAGAFHYPRLARAITAVIDTPAAGHTVESLASLAGMSRASFSDYFSRAFGQSVGSAAVLSGVRGRLSP